MRRNFARFALQFGALVTVVIFYLPAIQDTLRDLHRQHYNAIRR